MAETKCMMDEELAESWEEAADSGVGKHTNHTRGLEQSVRFYACVGKSVAGKCKIRD